MLFGGSTVSTGRATTRDDVMDAWKTDKNFIAWVMDTTGCSEEDVHGRAGMEFAYWAWLGGREYQHNHGPNLPDGVLVYSTLDKEVDSHADFHSKTYGGIFVTPGREQEAREILKEMDQYEWEGYAPSDLVRPIPEKFSRGSLRWTGKFDAKVADFLDECRTQDIEAWVLTGYREDDLY